MGLHYVGPLGVSGFTILLFEAVLMCAIEIAENRAGKPEAASAISFLEYISVERLMLFAMLGDAGDEAYQLTLSVESEDFDIANAGSFISSFVEPEKCYHVWIYQVHGRISSRRPGHLWFGGNPRHWGEPVA